MNAHEIFGEMSLLGQVTLIIFLGQIWIQIRKLGAYFSILQNCDLGRFLTFYGQSASSLRSWLIVELCCCRRSRCYWPAAAVVVASAYWRLCVTATLTFQATQSTTTTFAPSFSTSVRSTRSTPTGTRRASVTASTGSSCSWFRASRTAAVHTTSYRDSISSRPARRQLSTPPPGRRGASFANCSLTRVVSKNSKTSRHPAVSKDWPLVQ